MRKHKDLILHLVMMAVIFYVFPLVVRNTGIAMLVMLFVMPVCCFAVALQYGFKHSINLWLTLGSAALFVPTIFIFYNPTAWVYTIVYAFVVFSGNGIGKLIQLGMRS